MRRVSNEDLCSHCDINSQTLNRRVMAWLQVYHDPLNDWKAMPGSRKGSDYHSPDWRLCQDSISNQYCIERIPSGFQAPRVWLDHIENAGLKHCSGKSLTWNHHRFATVAWDSPKRKRAYACGAGLDFKSCSSSRKSNQFPLRASFALFAVQALHFTCHWGPGSFPPPAAVHLMA